MVVPPKDKEKRYRVDRRDLEIGTKQELQTSRSKNEARRRARNNLVRHPSYYDVMPLAKREMFLREQNIKPLKKKPKPRPSAADPVRMMTFVPKIRYPGN
jgi:hypothetical protein